MTEKIIEPQLSTMIVELKVIKVGNKQMTFGVFNQLYHGRCYDDNFNVTSKLWGKVSYKYDDWVVFQVGGMLRRMRIPSSLTEPVETIVGYWDRRMCLAEKSITAQIREELSGRMVAIGAKHYSDYSVGDGGLKKYRELGFILDKIKYNDTGLGIDIVSKYISDENKAILHSQYLNYKCLAEKRLSLYNKLNGLDQLFIAV